MSRFSGDVDIIWNITRLCPWDCSICCVDAIHVHGHPGTNTVALRTHGLSRESALPLLPGADAFSVASEHYQAAGLELTLSDKFRIVDHLEGFKARLDISGGDPLVLADNWKLLEFASKRLGKANVSLTATGNRLGTDEIASLAQYICEFNFTFDPALSSGQTNRPVGYSEANLHIGSLLAKNGVSTRAELPLTSLSCSPGHIRSLYTSLSEAGIHRLLLMRLFPVGRGVYHSSAAPSRETYLDAVGIFRDLEKRYGTPSVQLQCALRHLAPPVSRDVNPCDLLTRSLGLMADGTLLLSPWAIGPHGRPLANEFVLGNLVRSPLGDLLNRDVLKRLRSRLMDNFGHCKVFAYLHSGEADPYARLLDNTDPLFASPESCAF